MKHIKKKPSPEAFELWKETYEAKNEPYNLAYLYEHETGSNIWNALRSSAHPQKNYSKAELKEALVKEQGFICCYCNRAIDIDQQTEIEHFLPKAEFRKHTFEYTNLFASCNGFQKDPKPKDLCCGAKKGKKMLPISPSDEAIINHFDFTIDGQIIGLTAVGIEIIEILGLNIDKLVRLREVQIKNFLFLDPFESPVDDNFKSKEEATYEIKWLESLHEGKYEAFTPAVIKVLQNEILNK